MYVSGINITELIWIELAAAKADHIVSFFVTGSYKATTFEQLTCLILLGIMVFGLNCCCVLSHHFLPRKA